MTTRRRKIAIALTVTVLSAVAVVTFVNVVGARLQHSNAIVYCGTGGAENCYRQ